MQYSLIKLRGWSIHAITASGALVTLFAFYAIAQQELKLALLLMLLTIIIDAIDGPLARLWKVKHVVPNFDGALLDYIVDFSSWVLVPAFYLLCTHHLIPSPLNVMVSCMIVIASCYQFCCTDLKSTSSNFKRWPSAWSLLIILLALWDMPALYNFLIITACCILSFVPTYYSHPFQKNIFDKEWFLAPVMNGILIFSGIVFLISVLLGVLLYPTKFMALAVFQIAILITYTIFCLYGTYKNWN